MFEAALSSLRNTSLKDKGWILSDIDIYIACRLYFGRLNKTFSTLINIRWPGSLKIYRIFQWIPPSRLKMEKSAAVFPSDHRLMDGNLEVWPPLKHGPYKFCIAYIKHMQFCKCGRNGKGVAATVSCSFTTSFHLVFQSEGKSLIMLLHGISHHFVLLFITQHYLAMYILSEPSL